MQRCIQHDLEGGGAMPSLVCVCVEGGGTMPSLVCVCVWRGLLIEYILELC